MADFDPKSFAASPIISEELPTTAVETIQPTSEVIATVTDAQDIPEAAPGFNPKEFGTKQPTVSLSLGVATIF